MTSSADDTKSAPQSTSDQITDPTSEVMLSQHADQPAEEPAAKKWNWLSSRGLKE